MNLTIVSGGQTGADQGALRAARAHAIATAGWVPRGWLTEDGPAPWLAEYGLREALTVYYPARTRLNIEMAQALLWFGNAGSRGGKLTMRLAHDRFLPKCVVETQAIRPPEVAAWMRSMLGEKMLNVMVAGNREGANPGIGQRVEAFLDEVFRLLSWPDLVTCPLPPLS